MKGFNELQILMSTQIQNGWYGVIWLLTLAIVIFISWRLILFRYRKNQNFMIRKASLTVEELEENARKLSIAHTVSTKKHLLNWPIIRMNEDYKYIEEVYRSLNVSVESKRAVPPAGEWLLDNFYVIEEQVKSIRKDLHKKAYYKLPVLKKGPYKDYTRVFAIATELALHSDSRIEEKEVIRYLEAYQVHNILFDRELWMIPTMIHLALIAKIKVLCEHVNQTQNEWRKADEIVDLWLQDGDSKLAKVVTLIDQHIDEHEELNTAFVEHLFYRLRSSGRNYVEIFKYINDDLEIYNIDTEGIAQSEHNDQALNTVSLGNCIISLKYVATHNWENVFDASSYVEKILNQDPSDLYRRMDLDTRRHYRDLIEKLAQSYNVSELHIARDAIKMAKLAHSENKKLAIMNRGKGLQNLSLEHVGYYIADEGVKTLEKAQKTPKSLLAKFKKVINSLTGYGYIALILLLSYACVRVTVIYAGLNSFSESFAMKAFAIAIVLIPISELVISFVNGLVCRFKKPSFFCSLDFKDGIPSEYKTMVAIPALLTNQARVKELIDNMQNHYLSNPEDHLYFALIGAFKDSKTSKEQSDDGIIAYALAEVSELNKKYAKGKKDIFYFYHRLRTFNETDNNWIGWERKRGALMEFNEMLLGAWDTSIYFYSNDILPAANIKYVITLDADTILPIGMAKKMIGTMAHPLNTPVIDPKKGIVVKGYGLMQPRISFDMESANRSIFSCIYTQQEGIDPYASAISDVYQDLFGEGIFTGKGIYDLRVFQTVLKGVIPENKVLSHDLLEGTYVRAALVSTLELVDAYPSRYNAFVTRLRRWIRGDWQLIQWLGHRVRNGEGKLVKNPISAISKWKIFDNLRRSLVAPSLMVVIFGGVGLLPETSWLWIAFAMLVMFIPFFTGLFARIFRKRPAPARIKRHMYGSFGMKASIHQSILSFLFLPYQASMNLNAIIITLFRVVVSQKNMLEWVASADAERALSNDLTSYIRNMISGQLLAILLFALNFLVSPDYLMPGFALFLFWTLAPFVAYWISKDLNHQKEVLSESELMDLRKITRKTWRYFEEFANKKNNYLIPDNFQVDPRRGIAYRTSPTNIGLGLLAVLTARDMGYIGSIEMIESLERSVTSLKSLEKWDHHLFNWYDTRTLSPLEPRYVSTVDSGNLVCYLITLAQGLKEYRTRHLSDQVYVEGILDTYRIGFTDKGPLPEGIKKIIELEDTAILNLTGLKKIMFLFSEGGHLTALDKDVWKKKLELMIKRLDSELKVYFPWMPLIENLPSCLEDGLLKFHTEKLKKLCLEPTTLVKHKAYNHELHKQVELIYAISKNLGGEEEQALLCWIDLFIRCIQQSTKAVAEMLRRLDQIIEDVQNIADQTRFVKLYDPVRHLFSIGFNVEKGKLSNSYYDLLASEARQTSYLAIARGEIPSKHWFILGRSLTVIDRYKGLVSWSGTMFEYLMPILIMPQYKNSLLDETYNFVIRSQKKYAKQRNMPWGASESAYNALDNRMDYQYKAVGVPWLGLKRGLVEDAVTTPYATFLALLVKPKDAYQNILYLKKEGLEGPYGFYEAADYTPERLATDEKRVVIKSYMAHHQGMIILSLNNYLNGCLMQKRFNLDPYMKAARLLLQEKVPSNIVFTKDNKEKILPSIGNLSVLEVPVREFQAPNFNFPKMHILSNGNYSVLMTDQGTGYSKSKSCSISRWREDHLNGQYGMFFYVKNLTDNETWSAAYAPMLTTPLTYGVTFTPDKASYVRTDGLIETQTEVVVASGDHAEIRSVRLTNNGEQACQLEITSYFELVLTSQESDLAHPAFSNLFIHTEFDEYNKALIASRRSRSETDKAMWVAQMPVLEGHAVGDIQFETDRMKFIGRSRTVANPECIERDRPLTNSVGPVLDPIFSLRVRFKVDSGKTAKVSYVTLLAESRESLMALIDKYASADSCLSAFWTALTRSQVEAKYLNINSVDMILYQNAISNLLAIGPLRRQCEGYIKMNHQGQSALWAFGISGDRPIILLVIDHIDQVNLLSEALKAHEYWWIKDLKTDLVIIYDEDAGYLNPLKHLIEEVVYSNQTRDVLSRLANVFIIGLGNLLERDMTLLYSVARLIFRGSQGPMSEQLTDVNTDVYPPLLTRKSMVLYTAKPDENLQLMEQLRFYNGIGGFHSDGKSYLIRLEHQQHTPMPWVNIIANENFGFIVSESGGGFTWFKNSRENKLTPWSNDPVCDQPSEIFYLRDESKEVWSMTALPIREEEPYYVEHGFGYTAFKHQSHGIAQLLTQFVPVEDAVKISLIELRNEGNQERKITLTYYMTPVLGVGTENSALHIVSSQSPSGALILENGYSSEFSRLVCFMDSSESERSITGNRTEFFGKHKAWEPEALKRLFLSGSLGAGYDPCAAMQVNITLAPYETKKLVYLLGNAGSLGDADALSAMYKTPTQAILALEEVKAFWCKTLEQVQVKTPNLAMNTLLNGWLQYQVISCRLWARSGFYQSGGAFGFRDQLQDSLAIMNTLPHTARSQIIKHGAHQFIEGDVLHWWHEPAEKGTRTRVSDDLLWLPYAASDYVMSTGDQGILDVMIPFLEEQPLAPYEDERYCQPRVTTYSESLYKHCLLAIEHSFKFGSHGLPLIGGGDWNDGMNTVGNQGQGESVWLAWFLCATLKKFLPICGLRHDLPHIQSYNVVIRNLSKAIENYGWDGSWYKRAYFDNGMSLGSADNSECKIDSLSQSWAVISGIAPPERAKKSLESLENYLVKREDGLIKLLTPPFENGDLEPGYIKGYASGIRENGGQYTHAAAWIIIATAMQGDGNRAQAYFDLINPINHARTYRECSIYKVEPYVMAADVYGEVPHIGRGGWTWYTGSAGWTYKAGLENILGLTKEGNELIIEPCISQKWPAYQMDYQHHETSYHIQVNNPEGVSTGVNHMTIDEVRVENNRIKLFNDGQVHQVEVFMGVALEIASGRESLFTHH